MKLTMLEAHKIKQEVQVKAIPDFIFEEIAKASEKGQNKVEIPFKKIQNVETVIEGLHILGYNTYEKNIGWFFFPEEILIIYF